MVFLGVDLAEAAERRIEVVAIARAIAEPLRVEHLDRKATK